MEYRFQGQGPSKEIRLAWHAKVVHKKDSLVAAEGRWHSATYEHWNRLRLLLGVASRSYGSGSHWIEERDANGEHQDDGSPDCPVSCIDNGQLADGLEPGGPSA